MTIEDTKICAHNIHQDSCLGDRGGPMAMFKQGDDRKCKQQSYSAVYLIILFADRYHLIGVESFKYQCEVEDFPVVYTRVTEYDKWIRDTISKGQQ